MTKLCIGVMGCANIATRTVIPTMDRMDSFDVVSVASRSAEKAETTAQRFGCKPVIGYDALLSDNTLDAIYMPLPTGLHEEWVMKCLEAGKHVLIEKSLAINLASAQRIVKAARDKDLLIMENFMFLYHSQHATIRNMIKNGDIGDIRCFRSSFGFPPLPADNFRYDRALGGGALLDAAAYTVRASQLFLGTDLSVSGAVLNYFESSDADIFGGAFLSAPNGQFSEVAFGFDNFYQCDYEIWGSKGKITAKKAFTPKPNERPKIIIERQDHYSEILADADDHFENILSEFSNRIMSAEYADKYDEILHQSRLLQEIRDISDAV